MCDEMSERQLADLFACAVDAAGQFNSAKHHLAEVQLWVQLHHPIESGTSMVEVARRERDYRLAEYREAFDAYFDARLRAALAASSPSPTDAEGR